jgi:hypothetical protein
VPTEFAARFIDETIPVVIVPDISLRSIPVDTHAKLVREIVSAHFIQAGLWDTCHYVL